MYVFKVSLAVYSEDSTRSGKHRLPPLLCRKCRPRQGVQLLHGVDLAHTAHWVLKPWPLHCPLWHSHTSGGERDWFGNHHFEWQVMTAIVTGSIFYNQGKTNWWYYNLPALFKKYMLQSQEVFSTSPHFGGHAFARSFHRENHQIV